MNRQFVPLDWQKVNEFAQVFGYTIEDARDVLTYIVEQDILNYEHFAVNRDEPYDADELNEAYAQGWEDAVEECENSLPSRYEGKYNGKY